MMTIEIMTGMMTEMMTMIEIKMRLRQTFDDKTEEIQAGGECKLNCVKLQ